MHLTKSKTYLAVSGSILVLIGAYISFSPFQYLAQFSLNLSDNIDFLSDLRSMGGNLFLFGMAAWFGVFNNSFTNTAITMATMIFLSYGLFRMTGILIDGTPGIGILIAAAIEFILAGIGLELLIQAKSSSFPASV